jgi:hypothetical protein
MFFSELGTGGGVVGFAAPVSSQLGPYEFYKNDENLRLTQIGQSHY